MMQFLRKMTQIPPVSLLRTKKLRPTKNRVPGDLSAPQSMTHDSSLDDTSHLSEQETNPSYEVEDGTTFDIDEIGGEKTQNTIFYYGQGVWLNETIGLYDRPLIKKEKYRGKRTLNSDDDRSLVMAYDHTPYYYEDDTPYYYEDDDMESIELGTSKKVTFHPDMISEVMYINKRKSVSLRFTEMLCGGCDSSYTNNKCTYPHYSCFKIFR
jgi:hypothetical protein